MLTDFRVISLNSLISNVSFHHDNFKLTRYLEKIGSFFMFTLDEIESTFKAV